MIRALRITDFVRIAELELSLGEGLTVLTGGSGEGKSLVLEAMTAWTYWREQTRDIPTLFHSMHSKDHFATNVAVAGGLLLLQHDGGGKYTLDSYLKKKD